MHKALFPVLIVFLALGMIRSDEAVKAGGQAEMHINIVNEDDFDYEGVQVSMLIYEAGEYMQTNTFEVNDNEKIAKWLFWETGKAKRGMYLARITLSNDNFRQTEHRVIEVY